METHSDTLALTETDVIAYLKRHPDFLKKHPELLQVLTPPQREMGGEVVDFQHFQLKNLQKNAKSMKHKYEDLVDYCRDNMSVQSQVHDAALRLIQAHTLEQLLEVVTVDLLSLFDLDVVRLAVESEAAAFYETYYSEQNYSGIVFIPPGTADHMLGTKKALLIENAQDTPIPGFELIFEDCAGLVQSYALLKLEQESLAHPMILAFGVRHAGRFHTSQGIELLSFLARIVANRLEVHLGDLSA